MQQQQPVEEALRQYAAWGAEKKARDIAALKLSELTLICDYFLLMTAANNRNAQAICDYIVEQAKAAGQPPLRIEGYRDARWILLDFGSVIIHIFIEEERQFYSLERLWSDAPLQKFN
ncbi:MAG: ribosome silencing factor [Bacillota bacterium]|nr:ribosome silencing factor [Bacillota bacterium]